MSINELDTGESETRLGAAAPAILSGCPRVCTIGIDMILARLAILGVVVGAIIGSPPASDAAVAPQATLSVAGGPQALWPIAASDNTAVADGSGRAYVFTNTGSVWPNETQAAALVDSEGASAEPTAVALEGSTVVVDENGIGGGYEDVFSEPPGGWTGAVTESARLVASDGAVLYGAATDGSTVVAVGTLPSTGVTSLYVFTRPAGGWEGVVSQSAILTDGNRATISSVAISGRYVFGSAGDRVDVFQEPALGWAGDATQTATLTAYGSGVELGPVDAAPNIVVAGTYVFTEPAGGWGRGAHPAAELVPAGDTLAPGFALAASNDILALSAYALGAAHGCPCSGAVWVFTRPVRGWSGILTAPASVHASSESGPIPLAVSGDQLFVGGQPGVAVYTVTGAIGQQAGPPGVSAERITGLAAGRPSMTLAIRAGHGAPRMRSVALTLPSGLRLASTRHGGIRVTGAGPYALRADGRSLVVSCEQSCVRARFAIGPPALTEGSGLRARVLAIEGRRWALRLEFNVQVTYPGLRPIELNTRVEIR